jgi:hypothetical protein
MPVAEEPPDEGLTLGTHVALLADLKSNGEL